MSSLKGRLLASLLALYTLFAAIALLINYHASDANITGFIDRQMHTLAISYSRRTSNAARPPPIRPVSDFAIEHQGAAIVEFWKPDGSLVFANWLITGITLQRRGGFHDVRAGGQSWRVYTLRSSPWWVQVVTSNDFRRRVIWDSAWNTAKPIAYLAPLSVALLWLIIRLILRPVDRLGRALVEQHERNFAELDVEGFPRELLPLMQSINDLLNRLRTAFETQQRFVEDAAHELRTPVTAVKLQLENLRRKMSGTCAAEFVQLDAGIQRLQRTVEQLLLLARQETASPATDRPGIIDLAEVLKAAVRDLVPLAESRGVDLGLGEVVAVSGRFDVANLRCAVDNLLDNAVRYSPAGGRVDVTMHPEGEGTVVEVTDCGPGIPVGELAQVFARFFRGSRAESPGSGLGLAIARSAADRCGASIELLNRPSGCGLIARIRVPVRN